MKRIISTLVLALLVTLSSLTHDSVVGAWYAVSRGGASGDEVGNDNDDDDPMNKLYGLQANKFVSVAPLMVAAVCSDGIVMIATHSSFLQEPLLLLVHDNNNNDDNNNDDQDDSSTNLIETVPSNSNSTTNQTSLSQGDDDTASRTKLPRDVPMYFRGPFRIQAIDSVGTTMLCAGWRTDGEALTRKCRQLAESELARFGPPNPGLGYGRYVAHEASLWLAQCAVSEQLRALSCVALLAVSGDQRSPGGYLWLVDVTGAYRVRAHAIGLGSASLNQRLWDINFTNYTKEEAAQKLLEMMMTEPAEENGKVTKDSNNIVVPQTILDPKALVEAAVLDSTQKRMIRIRQPFLGSKHLASAFVPTKVSSI